MPRLFCLIALFVLMMSSAEAHKVIASAWTDGADIEGEVGFSNGDMAASGTIVEVLDSNNNKLGETSVTEDGLFRFTPTQSIAHTFSANMGAGHVASVVVSVEELPEHLQAGIKDTAQETIGQPVQTADTATSVNSAEIAKLVAKAVRKEVQPLRKEIASYKEKNDMQSILGGIGYILGLTGIVFYLAARRKESSKT